MSSLIYVIFGQIIWGRKVYTSHILVLSSSIPWTQPVFGSLDYPLRLHPTESTLRVSWALFYARVDELGPKWRLLDSEAQILSSTEPYRVWPRSMGKLDKITAPRGHHGPWWCAVPMPLGFLQYWATICFIRGLALDFKIVLKDHQHHQGHQKQHQEHKHNWTARRLISPLITY